MKNNSLIGGPQSTTHQQHQYQKPHNKPNFNMNTKRRSQPHNSMMINKQHQNNTINKQQIQKINNEEQNNLNKLKICMEANRRNINQRLNINNNSNNNSSNSNNGQQTRQNQQQSDNNRFQNNKQLILIKTDENDSSSKNSGLKRPLESSNETETTKKICQETPIVDAINEADRSVIKVECKIKNKLSNDENYEIDAFYCKCCCLIIHDEATIKEHLITDLHKTNVSKF
jgi:hypothetical protein